MRLNIGEAASFCGLTKQSIRVAIRKELLPSDKKGPRKGAHYFEKKDLQNYLDNRWCRLKNFGPDEMSPMMAAKFIGCDVQRIYHLIRTDKIPFFFKSTKMITLMKEDVEKIKAYEDERKKRKLLKKKLNKITMRRILPGALKENQ